MHIVVNAALCILIDIFLKAIKASEQALMLEAFLKRHRGHCICIHKHQRLTSCGEIYAATLTYIQEVIDVVKYEESTPPCRSSSKRLTEALTPQSVQLV